MSASTVLPFRPGSTAWQKAAQAFRLLAEACEEKAQEPDELERVIRRAVGKRATPAEADEDVTVEEAMRKTGLKRPDLLRLTRGKPWRRRYSHANIRFERRGFERWRREVSR